MVFPRYGVNRSGAVSRVAYGLASIVNPVCETVYIVTHQRKGFGGASFPQRRQRNPIVGYAGWACGVHGTVFGKSDDFSAVIDGAGLPIISAERRKSPHVAVSPKERNARKVCVEAANVFAVRIWIRCFGITNGFPAVVDPAIVIPTVAVVFSKRAQVDVESVDAYHRAATCNCRPRTILGSVHDPIHVLRPPLIIEAHDHGEVVLVLVIAQVGNFVTLLSERIAKATQNNRRNTRNPGIAQPS